MKSRLDVFLELSFKIGKVVSTMLLVLVLLLIIVCGLSLFSFNSVKIETPSFKTMEQIWENNSQENSAEISHSFNANKNSKGKYDKEIENIINKNNLSVKVIPYVQQTVKSIPVKYTKSYLKGLDSFCKDGLKYFDNNKQAMNDLILINVRREIGYDYRSEYNIAKNNIKEWGAYNYYISKGLIVEYDNYFSQNLEEVNKKIEENITKSVTAACILAIALFLFTILLFLPILIRIEENTRPALIDKQENENRE